MPSYITIISHYQYYVTRASSASPRALFRHYWGCHWHHHVIISQCHHVISSLPIMSYRVTSQAFLPPSFFEPRQYVILSSSIPSRCHRFVTVTSIIRNVNVAFMPCSRCHATTTGHQWIGAYSTTHYSQNSILSSPYFSSSLVTIYYLPTIPIVTPLFSSRSSSPRHILSRHCHFFIITLVRLHTAPYFPLLVSSLFFAIEYAIYSHYRRFHDGAFADWFRRHYIFNMPRLIPLGQYSPLRHRSPSIISLTCSPPHRSYVTIPMPPGHIQFIDTPPNQHIGRHTGPAAAISFVGHYATTIATFTAYSFSLFRQSVITG